MTTASEGEWVRVADCAVLQDHQPLGVRVAEVDLVIVRSAGKVQVLSGRCTHRNALLAEGHVADGALVCAHHGWDYDCATGRSRCDGNEALHCFDTEVRDGGVWVKPRQVRQWRLATPMDFYDDELDP